MFMCARLSQVIVKLSDNAVKLEHEAVVLRRLGRQTAPSLIESFVTGGTPEVCVLVLEAADGRGDLRHFAMHRNDSTTLSMRHHMQRLLHCVAAVHEHGLVHTEIGASNFLRFGGEWKLIDYDGVVSEGSELDAVELGGKTPAPEVVAAMQCKGARARMHASLDVWALGLVLFLLITGRDLFEPDDDTRDLSALPALIHARLHEPHRGDDSRQLTLEESDRRLLAKMLSVEPRERPTLSSILQGEFFQTGGDEHTRRLRHMQTDEPARARALGGRLRFHVFLSHTWKASADAMRVLKQRLGELVPSMSVFLDVRTPCLLVDSHTLQQLPLSRSALTSGSARPRVVVLRLLRVTAL